jgi:hypothetical protein
MIRRMRIACSVPEAKTHTDKHSVYVILLLLHCYSFCENALKWYVIRTLPVMLTIAWLSYCITEAAGIRTSPE